MALSLDGKKVWVAGHNGMVGSAIMRQLSNYDVKLLTVDREQLDLRDQEHTKAWLFDNKPDLIFLVAATVGGIVANDTYPSSFLYDNLMIEANVINAAASTKVEKLVFVASSCIYPKLAEQPIKEDALLTGPLEPTNEWYAIAKIAGIKLCQSYRKEFDLNFVSAMPTNLYGPNDNFDLETSHVLPALMHKIHLAKINNESQVRIWGTGKPRRELMHVDDCAEALVHIMKNYDDYEPINIGQGFDMEISEIAQRLAKILDWQGEFVYDKSKPDGSPRKLLDTSKLEALSWQSKIDFDQGVSDLYKWFLENH